MKSPYLVENINKHSKFRIFFFPYAGSGALTTEIYRKKFALHAIDFIPLQFPGREERIAENAFTEMNALIDDLIFSISPALDLPFLVWGHCSGAFIAFEFARKIKQLFQITPDALVASASRAPQILETKLPNTFHTLADKDLFMQVLKLMEKAFNSTEQTNNSQAVKILLPGIRADFQLYETYQYKPGAPLPCPILGLGANPDPLVPDHDLLAWKEQTLDQFSSFFLPDQHHYFVNNCSDILVEKICDFIKEIKK
jgi:medium-chain acyl-[acyl-carrier-protein] hydrolase